MHVNHPVPEPSDGADTAPPPRHPTARTLRVRRAIWFLYLAALVGTVSWRGLPTDRIYQAVWILVGVAAFTIDRPWRAHLRVLTDWLPLLAALVLYDLTRGSPTDSGCRSGCRNWCRWSGGCSAVQSPP